MLHPLFRFFTTFCPISLCLALFLSLSHSLQHLAVALITLTVIVTFSGTKRGTTTTLGFVQTTPNNCAPERFFKTNFANNLAMQFNHFSSVSTFSRRWLFACAFDMNSNICNCEQINETFAVWAALSLREQSWTVWRASAQRKPKEN